MRTATEVRAVPSLEAGRIELTWRNPPAADFAGGPRFVGVRVVRRTRTYARDADDGEVIYDGPIIAAAADAGLTPLTTYYYTVFAVDDAATPNRRADDRSRAAALATADYGLTERLYRMLPAVHQREDPLTPADLRALHESLIVRRPGFPPDTSRADAVLLALEALPASLRGQGPLRRFFHAAAAPLDLMRSTAEALPALHDPDRAPPAYLPSLAAWLDWPLDRTLPVHHQRGEVTAAPFLHRITGTPPSAGALVTRYTGWYARTAELHQSIARAHMPPQMNIFALVEDAGGWRGVDDAAPLLGFAPGNDAAGGGGALPAVLSGTAPGGGGPVHPFPLRPGMELTVSADGRPPVTVRFQLGDFATIGSATAREVAAVLNRAFTELSARSFPASPLGPPPPTENRIELRSHTPGPASTLTVERSETSLVSLEGSPRGRLSLCPDASAAPLVGGRVRLFYETSDPLEPATTHQARLALAGVPFPRGAIPGAAPAAVVGETTAVAPAVPLGRVRYKTFRMGTWGASLPLPGTPVVAQGDPAAVELPTPVAAGSIFAAWIEQPHTAQATIKFAVGRPRPPAPARLRGQRSQPFVLEPGTFLVLRGPWPDAAGVEFTSADIAGFVNPREATTAEVAAVLNARLTGVSAVPDPATNTLELRTAAVGGDAHLSVDLALSSAAAALGFGEANATSTGEWGDAIDWGPAQDVTAAPPGRHADLAAVLDSTGWVRLFWATHTGLRWQVMGARWDGVAWSAAERLAPPAADPDQVSVNREPSAALGGDGRIWLVWSRREDAPDLAAQQRDSWTLQRRVFDSGAGWGPVPAVTAALTAVPAGPGARLADREPSVRIVPGAPEQLHVYFRTDRGGGPDLWRLVVNTTTGVAAAPVQVTSGAAADGWPAPVAMPDGARWLLYRSDRGVPLARTAVSTPPAAEARVIPRPRARAWPSAARSVRLPDTGTLRRFAGTTSVVLGDASRIGRRRQWDDPVAYTPDKPLGELGPQKLAPDDLYTRGTIALYVSELLPESAVTANMVQRLRAALTRYLPINVRVVVRLAPRPFVEDVYTPAADIGESYADQYPEVEYYTGPGEDAALAVPWTVLHSNTLGDVSADPANPATLLRRTHFVPPI
jgi:phage tail-like protein